MAQPLPSLSSVHVLVVGDIIIDRYWYGDSNRVSQEAPVPVVNIDETENRPGGAANVALNVVSLGAKCTLVGAVGPDDAGARMLATLQAAGVTTEAVTVEGWETTLKLRIVSKRQQLLRTDFESPMPSVADQIARNAARCIDRVDVVILADYDKGVLEAVEDILRIAAAADVPVVADPKFKNLTRYRGAYLLKPNRVEFQRATGSWSDEAELTAKARQLQQAADVGAVVVTQGDAGITLVDAGDSHHIPAMVVDVYDETGAGDTVAATLAVATAVGWSPLAAARIANIAAALACTKVGTAAVSAPEVNQALARAERTDPGPVTQEQLVHAVQQAREGGEKIVFTNGCFDILHAGHVGYLEEARGIGDRLIVAVNDDASTQRLKGDGRPVNGLSRRMRVLEGLTAVDWVVPFAEDTPMSLLERIRPDVLVKGGDYSDDEVVGAEFVRSYGGEVRTLSLIEDCSTSDIVDRIRSVS